MTAVSNELLPSLPLIAERVTAQRETMSNHAERLDTKAGVGLGFAGVVVGLGSTASAANGLVFQVGLVTGAVAALLVRGPFCLVGIP